MTTKLVCYGAHAIFKANRLKRSHAFSLSVVEHVLGSNQFYVEENKENFTENLIAKLSSEDFLISENLFTALANDGFVKKSAVYSIDELHQTINDCKKHASREWELMEAAQ